MQRNTAINTLRGFGTFRHASLRLLDDLIDTVGAQHLASGEIDAYVQCAKEASFSLYWSLDLRFWNKSHLGGEPRSHTICLCASAGQAVPLEALGHLLAYSITRQFDEAAAVVSFADEGRMCLWHPQGFSGPKPLPANADAASVIAEFPEVPAQPFYHMIFVHPRPSRAAATAQRFHRIVYVNAEAEIAAVPAHLKDLLIDAVWDDAQARIAPRFSSFISTHFLGEPETRPGHAGCDVGAQLQAALQPGALRTQPIGEALAAERRPAAWRLRRDLCRLSMDLGTIGRSWRAWSRPAWAHHAFAEELFEENPTYRDSVFRWARAITNRQVGLALSGGGASSYRMVPILRSLHSELGIPLDVLAGVGGGALLAGYYSAAGLGGLDKAVAEGTALTGFALGAMACSRLIRMKVDFDLRAARIERLERRFVPLTTVMKRGRVPEHHAVIGGTIGAGVSVSGAAPLAWGHATRNGRRYADGSGAILAAARSLKEHGADMVLACSCVPGPVDGDPVPYYLHTYALLPAWLANGLTRYTLLGRISDDIVAAAFLRQQTSREMAGDAHTYIEPHATPISILEGFAFYEARRLVGASERELRQDADSGGQLLEVARLWDRFRSNARGRKP